MPCSTFSSIPGRVLTASSYKPSWTIILSLNMKQFCHPEMKKHSSACSYRPMSPILTYLNPWNQLDHPPLRLLTYTHEPYHPPNLPDRSVVIAECPYIPGPVEQRVEIYSPPKIYKWEPSATARNRLAKQRSKRMQDAWLEMYIFGQRCIWLKHGRSAKSKVRCGRDMTVRGDWDWQQRNRVVKNKW